MAKKRTLKTAVADPLAKETASSSKDPAAQKGDRRPAIRIGYAVIAAVVIAGFVGGWMARKYFRLL